VNDNNGLNGTQKIDKGEVMMQMKQLSEKVLFFILISTFLLMLMASVCFADDSQIDRMIFFRTGYSDCILIQSNGYYGIIDTANRSGGLRSYTVTDFDGEKYATNVNSLSSDATLSSGTQLANYMKNTLNIDHLDFIIISHAHSDHIGGLEEIANSGLVNSQTKLFYKTYAHTDSRDDDLPEDTLMSFDKNGNVEFYTKSLAKKTIQKNVNANGWHNQAFLYSGVSAFAKKGGTLVDVSDKIIINESVTQSKYPSVSNISNGTSIKNVTFNKGQTNNYYDDYISFNFGDFNIKLFNIYINADLEYGNTENTNSVIALVTLGNHKIVSMGDANVINLTEQKVAKAINGLVGKVDILKIGHHGYAASTALETIDLLQPKYAITTRGAIASSTDTAKALARSYAMLKYGTKFYETSYSTEGIVVDFYTNDMEITNLYSSNNVPMFKSVDSCVNDTFYPNVWMQNIKKSPANEDAASKDYGYTGDDGKAVIGWKRINNKWYYFDQYGVMKTGWFQPSGSTQWYYALDGKNGGTLGATVSGWQTLDYAGKSYQFYFEANSTTAPSAMISGRYQIDNYYYYFAESSSQVSGYCTGAMVMNATVNGCAYDSQGHEISAKIYSVNGKYYGTLAEAYSGITGSTGTIKMETSTIDNSSFTIAKGKTITIDTNGKIITKTGSSIMNNGTLKIIGNGSIKTTSLSNLINNTGTIELSNATLNNTAGISIYASSGNIIMNSGKMITSNGAGIYHTGAGAITIKGGTITVTGNAAINNRGTASVTITGGTIVSTSNNSAVSNVSGIVTIGAKDGNASTIVPEIRGAIGISSENGFQYYDGLLRGSNVAISGGPAKVSAKETGFEVTYLKTAVNGVAYETTLLSKNAIFSVTKNGQKKYYATLERAYIGVTGINNTDTTGTIVVEKNCVDSYAFNVGKGKTVTLNTNGKDLTKKEVGITNQGTLNIIGNGTIRTTATVASNAITHLIINDGTLNISSATIRNMGKATGGWNTILSRAGTVTVNSGTIKVQGTTTSETRAIVMVGTSNVIINGGTIVNESSNGQAVASWTTADTTSTGTLKIKGGIVSSMNSNAIKFFGLNGKTCASNLEITGGTVMSTPKNIAMHTILLNKTVNGSTSGYVTITGGIILSSNAHALVNYGFGKTIIGANTTTKTNTPVLQGGRYGIYAEWNFAYYNGVIRGTISAINGGTNKIANNEIVSRLNDTTESINGIMFKVVKIK